MRQLLPEPVDSVDPMDLYADVPVVDGRPSVRINMVASVDGATTIEGVSGGLSSPADRRVFHALRAMADVVVVAAGTLRADNYGPAKIPVAVVTRSCRLDWQAPFFTSPIARPVVVTVSDAPPDALAHAGEVADLVLAGEGDVDVRRAVAALGERGASRLLVEGGPSLNSQLARAGLVDELCLTVAPNLVGGMSRRVVGDLPLSPPTDLRIRSLCEEDGFLFYRFQPVR